MKNVSLACAITLGAASLLSMSAMAATYPSQYQQNGSGVCQAATPFTAGTMIRARPAGLFNDGTSTAYVTCSPPYDDEASEQPNAGGMWVLVQNNSGLSITLSCSATTGIGVVTATVTHTVSGFGSAQIYWYPSEFPGAQPTIYAPSISCALPPGTGVSAISYNYDRRS